MKVAIVDGPNCPRRPWKEEIEQHLPGVTAGVIHDVRPELPREPCDPREAADREEREDQRQWARERLDLEPRDIEAGVFATVFGERRVDDGDVSVPAESPRHEPPVLRDSTPASKVNDEDACWSVGARGESALVGPG